MEQYGVMLSLNFLLVTLDATLQIMVLTIALTSLVKRFSVVLRIVNKARKKEMNFGK